MPYLRTTIAPFFGCGDTDMTNTFDVGRLNHEGEVGMEMEVSILQPLRQGQSRGGATY